MKIHPITASESKTAQCSKKFPKKCNVGKSQGLPQMLKINTLLDFNGHLLRPAESEEEKKFLKNY